MSSIPIVDIAEWTGHGSSFDTTIATAVDRACRDHGVVLVSGHGVDAALIAELDEVTRDFFHQPGETKLRARLQTPSGGLRGYRPSGVALAKSLGVETPPDLVEAFSINNPAFQSRPDSVPSEFDTYYAPNAWPDVPAGFRSTWLEYYVALDALTETMLQIFATALALPTRWFADKFDHHYSGLLANFYPAQHEPPLPGQVRRGAHSDYGAFTLLYQDDAPGGLEVLDAAGQWRPVGAVPGTFVLNIGDLMSAWTNDRWVSPLHRVVNPPAETAGAERLSVPFFVNPNVDALVECIPTCCSDGAPPRHPAVHAGEWVVGKIRKSVVNTG